MPSESSRVSICSTPVEEAQTKSGSSFEGHYEEAMQFAQAVTCARLCLLFFFRALSFSPSCLSMQKCSSVLNSALPTCKRCARHCLLDPWLLLVSASCSVKKEERLGKDLDHLRAGAKRFQAQNLLDPC